MPMHPVTAEQHPIILLSVSSEKMVLQSQKRGYHREHLSLYSGYTTRSKLPAWVNIAGWQYQLLPIRTSQCFPSVWGSKVVKDMRQRLPSFLHGSSPSQQTQWNTKGGLASIGLGLGNRMMYLVFLIECSNMCVWILSQKIVLSLWRECLKLSGAQC